MALICLKSGTECGSNWVENRIYSAPAVKGLNTYYCFNNSGLFGKLNTLKTIIVVLSGLKGRAQVYNHKKSVILF